MFYNEEQAIKACEEAPSLIFELLKEGHIELLDKILSMKLVDINTCDDMGNDIVTRLLKAKQYSLVLKHMKNKNWDINHQNQDGDTFAHILASIHYVNVIEIINQLKMNPNFMPNIKNNKGETILDKSINDHYIYTTVKILEDERFTNIDLLSFKNLYETYIKSSNYGKYSKLTNLEVILERLEEKALLPKMSKLLFYIKNNLELIKEEIMGNNPSQMDQLIHSLLEENE